MPRTRWPPLVHAMQSDVSSTAGAQDRGRTVEELEQELSEAHRRLTETLEHQRVTGEILHAISNSPTDAQSVLGAIAESAARLLDVAGAEIMRVENQMLTLVTKHGSFLQWPVGSQRPISRNWVTGRAVVDRTTIHVPDLQAAENDFPEGAAYAKEYGHRTTLATPLLREGVPIGAILIRRMDVRPFSDRQIRLLETFADQAVIAIENTRLFEAEQARTSELQARSAELAQSLEYQTAISNVLGVISRSPNEVQPVLDTISRNGSAAYARPSEPSFGLATGRGFPCGRLQRSRCLQTRAAIEQQMPQVAPQLLGVPCSSAARSTSSTFWTSRSHRAAWPPNTFGPENSERWLPYPCCSEARP